MLWFVACFHTHSYAGTMPTQTSAGKNFHFGAALISNLAGIEVILHCTRVM
jgi:hypothetical protein